MEQLKEALRHVIVKPCRISEEQKSRLAERIAQAGRTGLMGAARPQKPRAARRGKRSGRTKGQRHKVANKRKPQH